MECWNDGILQQPITKSMKANILVVDDTPDNVRLLMEILGERGYKTRPALDGPHALATTHAEPPDLILLDIIMPKMDGYQVCEQLKADERTRDIPVIFISALNRVFDKVKAFSVGAVDYITKPFQAEEVLARVETHLALRNLQKNLQQEIARRKQSEEELRKLYQQLQEANASKNKFFSIIGHDLRGPVGTLRELNEIIVENSECYSKDEIIKMMLVQRDSTNNLFALLENLLTWARSQQEMIKYQPQRINMMTIVTSNIALLTSKGAQKEITLRNGIEEKIFVYADYHMVNTVVRNLLSNALKFTQPQGTIDISATQNGRYVEVAVSDTGTGIPEECLAQLFRIDARFKRLGTANEQGTGLGLILCKEFVERHGGRIWVESEVGRGTIVRFTLPCWEFPL